MGVYADRTASPFDDPRVETIASLVKRRLGMAVGVVTNTEIEDATPAAMVAHTRRRAAYDEIVEQFFAAKPDVLMGGGSREFPAEERPRAAPRKDETDYIAKFRDAGYAVATTAAELRRCRKAETGKLLGLFDTGNMDGVLDRKFLKGGAVKKFPEQPDLTEQVGPRSTCCRANRGLLPDGRIRPDRQIHPVARHGARRLRHDHARQRSAAGARMGAGARRRHPDPGAGGPQPSQQPCRHNQ